MNLKNVVNAEKFFFLIVNIQYCYIYHEKKIFFNKVQAQLRLNVLFFTLET